MTGKTLYDKLWDAHVVQTRNDGTAIIYIDRHLIHEITSPQAFAGMRSKRRRVHRPSTHIAMADHTVPTSDRKKIIPDPVARTQIETLETNCRGFGLEMYKPDDPRHGIVHVACPEQGLILPGMTVVCGDSHTATHGAFGALAFGIGTSEVEQVLATQCLAQKKSKNMLITVNGDPDPWVSAKDIALTIIKNIGTAGGTGHAIEFAGNAIDKMSMEARMTICNMAIEAGARTGLVAVDQKTIQYLKNRPGSPEGLKWKQATAVWMQLKSNPDAFYESQIEINAELIPPQVTWGTSPEMAVGIHDRVPNPANESDSAKRRAMRDSQKYMGLEEGTIMGNIRIDKIFIGSCTNSRIEDLRSAAAVVKGKQIASSVKQALVVPGSGLVKREAEKEGIDQIFKNAGFQWREPGCSMCLAMNGDKLEPGERCASTSNRNFQGRQGAGGRTHLVSPPMAAAAAITGHFVDVREFVN